MKPITIAIAMLANEELVLQEGGGPSKNLSEYLQGSEARKVARAANSSGVPPKT